MPETYTLYTVYLVQIVATGLLAVLLPLLAVEEVAALIGTDDPYLIDSGFVDPRRFEILAPVWTESLVGDGLFDFDTEDLSGETRTELLGFVGINLDFEPLLNDGVYEFLFVWAPLKMVGATGSPGNPVALY